MCQFMCRSDSTKSLMGKKKRNEFVGNGDTCNNGDLSKLERQELREIQFSSDECSSYDCNFNVIRVKKFFINLSA